jgi:hypothetical protein
VALPEVRARYDEVLANASVNLFTQVMYPAWYDDQPGEVRDREHEIEGECKLNSETSLLG